MVPHTHDDVGWLKTVDQYYYGSETLIQKAGVQYIIDSFIQELINDPEKRFFDFLKVLFTYFFHQFGKLTQIYLCRICIFLKMVERTNS